MLTIHPMVLKPPHDLGRPATREDLDALPENVKGEILDGRLYAMTRPRAVHQEVAGSIAEVLRPAFQRGRGGPGGWWILPAPGIELPRAKEVSPDLAGWRRERMPSLPRNAPIVLVPDWVCEVLSPTTRRHNLLVKRPFYASIEVPWLWFADSEARVITVNRLEGDRWVEAGAWGDEREARIPPFDAVAVDVSVWWEALDAGGEVEPP